METKITSRPSAMAAPGIFPRAASIAAGIKKHKDFTESDGKDLGIIGSDIAIDLLHIKPNISVHLAAGGHPVVA